MSGLNLSLVFLCMKKYKISTCMCKTCAKWKKYKFLEILVSDKNTHGLTTYIHLSLWLFKVRITQC